MIPPNEFCLEVQFAHCLWTAPALDAKGGNVSEINKMAYRLSPDRLKLLWLLVRKAGIDFRPRQFSPSEPFIERLLKEPEPKPVKQASRSEGSDEDRPADMDK